MGHVLAVFVFEEVRNAGYRGRWNLPLLRPFDAIVQGLGLLLLSLSLARAQAESATMPADTARE
jgi:hypothetical protein